MYLRVRTIVVRFLSRLFRTDGTSVNGPALATLFSLMRTSYGVVHICTTSQLLYSILHDLITDSHPSDAREDRGGRALSVPFRTAISLAMHNPANFIMVASLRVIST